MVAALFRHDTVYTVLADSARRRSGRTLAVQFIVSLALAVAILIAAPNWWSLAFLAGWSAAYSAWGLVARVVESRESRPRSLKVLLAMITALGTALAVAGLIGVGLAVYLGDAVGAKNGACIRNASSERCQARQHPTPTPLKIP